MDPELTRRLLEAERKLELLLREIEQLRLAQTRGEQGLREQRSQ